MKRAFVGIDPGKSGGIAWITPHESANARAFKNLTDLETFEIVHYVIGVWPASVAVLEKVNAFPGQGVSSTFKFGDHFGSCKMALVGNYVPYRLVPAGTWQRTMSCLTKGNKNVTKEAASRLFPKIKITHAIADALLIAEYCRRTWATG